MNFRTTIVLFVLVVLGLIFFIVANRGGGESEQAQQTSNEGDLHQGRKLLEVNADDVRRLVVKPADGQPLELVKADTGEWSVAQPAAWRADNFEARNLVESIANLRSRGRVEQGTVSRADMGLEKPRFTIELSDRDKKTTTLLVGNELTLGNQLYVDAGDGKGASIATGGPLTTQLERGTQKIAEALRDKRLVTAQAADVKQVEVTKRGGQKLVLRKEGADWKVVEPARVNADSGEVSSLLSVVTGLRAEEFVKPDSPEAAGAMVDQPRLAVWFSTEAPATQPSTVPATAPATGPTSTPAGTSVAFGQYADVEQEKAYVKVSEPAVLATVNLSAWQWDRLFTASPVTLRDRKVLDVEPDRVEKVTIAIDKPAATQPTTRPAEKREVALERRRDAGSPSTAPATGPATGPATAAAPSTSPATSPTTTAATSPATATAPAEPPSKWVLTADPKGDAEDATVDSLLQGLHPLRASKYLDAAPTAPATATYVVRIHTNAYGDQPAQVHELKLTETGDGADAKVIGTYKDLVFEVDRFFLDRVTADFKKGSGPPPAPPSLPGISAAH